MPATVVGMLFILPRWRRDMLRSLFIVSVGGLQRPLPFQIRPVDRLEQLDVRQRVLAAGTERLAGAQPLARLTHFTPLTDSSTWHQSHQLCGRVADRQMFEGLRKTRLDQEG